MNCQRDLFKSWHFIQSITLLVYAVTTERKNEAVIVDNATLLWEQKKAPEQFRGINFENLFDDIFCENLSKIIIMVLHTRMNLTVVFHS
jgi:hypothetical protein